jgi:phosphohistidine phosphatase
MLLYLLRHAEAEVSASTDEARRLTAKGEHQAARVGKFCQRHGVRPALILSSPVTRALQTARIVARELPEAGLVEAPWAACGMGCEQACAELEACGSEGPVMLVGHQPDLGMLASFLLGAGSGGCLHVRKASLAALEVQAWRTGRAGLEFFVPARLM